MVCVTRWFCRQEGASSCPCCRRESGTYDDVPRAAEEGDEDDDDDDDIDGWSDDSSVVSVAEFWTRDSDGCWHRTIRQTVTGEKWNPVAEPDDIPLTVHEGAVALQRIWRGHAARRGVAVEALLALKFATLPAK